MNSKIWTRFILADGAVAVYEITDPAKNVSARMEIAGGKVVRFYEGGQISRADAAASVNAFRAKEWADFLDWAPRRNIGLEHYPAPPAIIV
jgi:hypothetical protein